MLDAGYSILDVRTPRTEDREQNIKSAFAQASADKHRTFNIEGGKKVKGKRRIQ